MSAKQNSIYDFIENQKSTGVLNKLIICSVHDKKTIWCILKKYDKEFETELNDYKFHNVTFHICTTLEENDILANLNKYNIKYNIK